MAWLHRFLDIPRFVDFQCPAGPHLGSSNLQSRTWAALEESGNPAQNSDYRAYLEDQQLLLSGLRSLLICWDISVVRETIWPHESPSKPLGKAPQNKPLRPSSKIFSEVPIADVRYSVEGFHEP